MLLGLRVNANSLTRSVLAVLVWTLTLGRAAAAMKPQVIETQFPTADVVIASLVLTAPAEGADATGSVQAAIDEAAAAGGGVVFLPSGQYRLEGALTVKEGVTLRGDWAPPDKGGAGKGTILLPLSGRGDADATPAITLERGSGIREVTVWYSEQRATEIVPYPWTIKTSPQVGGDNYTVLNATLVNPYQGLKVGPEWNELHTFRNVYGTPLKTGIWMDYTTDIGRVTDVHFAPTWWERSALPGAPTAAADRQALRDFLLREGTGVDMGRSDWEYLWGVHVSGYGTGMVIRPGEKGTANAVMFASELLDCATALRLVGLNGVGLSATGCTFTAADAAVQAPASFSTVSQFNTCSFGGTSRAAVLLEGCGTLTFQNCAFTGWRESALEAQAGTVSVLGSRFEQRGRDCLFGDNVRCVRMLGNRFVGEPVIEAACVNADVMISHAPREFARCAASLPPAAPTPVPRTRDLFDVTAFGASPQEGDSTQAFQRALDAAGKAGGGTVYVPAGNYRFAGALTVPTGVELRGIFDVPHHTVSAGSVLMCTAGRGEEDGTPFLQLEAGSGVRGITVWYPEQNLADITPYPWAIRSLGPKCWLIDVCLGNAYQGADFWTHPSDGHVIQYLAGGLLRRGLFVSKCDGDGWVEDVQFNPHYTARLHASLPAPKYEGDVFGGVIDQQRHFLEGLVFGRCEQEHLNRNFLYAAHDGIAFRDDRGGANAIVINHGTDTGSRAAVLEASGDRGVDFLNAQLVPLGNYEVGALVAPPDSKGSFRLFNSQVWAGNRTGLIEGSAKVLVQQMNTLSGGFELKGGECTLENIRFERDLDPHVSAEGGSARLVAALSAPGLLRMRNDIGDACSAVANSVSFRPAADRFTFESGWEEGQPQGAADQIATRGGGIRAVSGQACAPVVTAARAGARALRVTAGRTTRSSPVGARAGARALRVTSMLCSKHRQMEGTRWRARATGDAEQDMYVWRAKGTRWRARATGNGQCRGSELLLRLLRRLRGDAGRRARLGAVVLDPTSE